MGSAWNLDPEIARQQMVTLFEALDRQVADGGRMAEATLTAVTRQHYHPYNQFRRQIDEALALMAIIEEFLDRFDQDKVPALRTELTRLFTSLMALYVRTVRDFFAEMARTGVLPLGAKQLFGGERDVLNSTRQRMAGQPHDLEQAMDDALRLLTQILANAPDLPDFDAPVDPSDLTPLRPDAEPAAGATATANTVTVEWSEPQPGPRR